MNFISKIIGSGVSELATGVADVIDKFVETEEEKKAAELLLIKIQQQPDKWQMEINKIEARHRSIFVAGWRPAIGWICALGLSFHFIVFPLLEWGSTLAGNPIPIPKMESGELMTLVLSLLGLGGLRSYEKRHNLVK